MAKETTIKIKVTPSLNRSIVLTAFPTGKPVNFVVSHSKQTTALQFQVDSNASCISTGDVIISMYRNLENCKFCQTFFQLETKKTDSIDFRGKFSGVNRQFDRDIFSFLKEKLDLQLSDSTKNGKPHYNNYLLILGWKLFGLEDDVLFYFIQRKAYNTVLRSQIIRTAGLQFATKRGIDALEKYHEKSINGMTKVDHVSFLHDESGKLFDDFEDELEFEKESDEEENKENNVF